MMPNGNAQSDSGACLKPSGAKLRADAERAICVCALIDAINATRARIESGYKVAVPAAPRPQPPFRSRRASPPPSLSLRSLGGSTDSGWPAAAVIAETRAMSKRYPSAAEFDVTLLLELLG